MNPSCTQERKFIELNRVPINVPPKQEMQKSEKLMNTHTSFSHIVMQIMQEISLIDSQSPPQFIYLLIPSSTGDPINILKNPESVQMQKQEQYTQVC